jgi:hypothetical protein
LDVKSGTSPDLLKCGTLNETDVRRKNGWLSEASLLSGVREPHWPEAVNITVDHDHSMQKVPQTFASRRLHSRQTLLGKALGGAAQDRTGVSRVLQTFCCIASKELTGCVRFRVRRTCSFCAAVLRLEAANGVDDR